METVFAKILNMSLTASIVIAVVLLARLALKKAPKIYSYALWAVVLFRLLCPVSIQAPVSVLQVTEPEVVSVDGIATSVSYIPAQVVVAEPQVQRPAVQNQPAEIREDHSVTLSAVAALLWAAGAAVMLLRSIVENLQLRSRLIGAIHFRGNVYLADHISTAFVLGLFRPKIYLPSHIPGHERRYIVAHERHHIRRGDHIIKLLAYVALSIHWFNPLVWVAFVQAGKDMEMSCDEAVIRQLGSGIRADYSASLLRLAARHRIIGGTPLAFGEGDTKGRIRNMAKWKKPAKWVVAICLILCLSVVAVCAFNPEEDIPIEELTRHTSESPVGTAIGDLCFTYPGGLTSELRDVDNWNEEDKTRSRRDLPTRRQYNHFFIDNGVDFGGVVDFIVPEDREIRLEEMNLPTEWIGLDYIGGSSFYPYAEMEYTLIKDGKDYIQMYLYTYSGRGYFLWFYTEQGNAAHKEAILNSVELGSFSSMATKLKQNEILSLGQFSITIPKGYGYHRSEDKILEITRKERFGEQVVVGCVTAKPNPKQLMENEADLIRWVEAVGIDLSGEGIFSEIADESAYGDVSIKIRNTSGLSPMEEEHYLYIAGDTVYDLWIDPAKMDESTKTSILKSIWIKDTLTASINTVPQADLPIVDADISTDMELVQYGTLKMLLPSGFAATEAQGVVVLTKDSVNVGGITCWNYPEFQPSDIVKLREEEYGVPIGYMSSSSVYGDTEYEIFWDGNPAGLCEQHTFFIDGDIIYDVWYDQNQISAGIAERFLKTVAINADPVIEEKTDEQEALAKCRAVLEAVQSGSCHIVIDQSSPGNTQSHWSTANYYQDNGNWLKIVDVDPETDDIVDGEQYSFRMAFMVVDGIRYSNEGKFGKAYSDIEWKKDDITFDDSVKPWLASFQWDDSVAYMDTLTDEDGECVMLRVDKQYIDSDEYDPHYFLFFNFDLNGNFVNVQLQVNLFRNNELAITESIASLDADTVVAEIRKEYDREAG